MIDVTPRAPSGSRTEMTEIVLPQHANAIGTTFGGVVMGWIDICAAVAAHRHCGRVAVTAAVDEMAFRAPIRVGDVVVLRSRVHAAFRTSLEVGVTVEREEIASRTRVTCVEARLTFVHVGDDGRPVPVPPLLLETDEDRQLAAEAEERRRRRLERR